MILNGWLVRFWRGPPGRVDLIWTCLEGCFTSGSLTWRGLTPVAAGKGRKVYRQAVAVGPRREGARAPPPLLFIVLLVGADVAPAGDVTPGAPLATNPHRISRLLRI